MNRSLAPLELSLGAVAMVLCVGCGGKSSTPSSGWQGTTSLESSTSLSSEVPSSGCIGAVDGSGNALALWIKSSTLWGHFRVPSKGWENREWGPYGAPGSWQGDSTGVDNREFIQLNTGGTWLVAGGQGNFTFVCGTATEPGGRVWAGQYRRDTGLLVPTPLSLTNTAWCASVSAVDSGNAAAVWLGDGRVQAATFDASANRWTTPVTVSQDGEMTEAMNPRVGMDSHGNVVVAWVQSNTFFMTDQWHTVHTIWASRLSGVTGSWSAPVCIQTDGLDSSNQCSLVMTDAGAQLAWTASTSGTAPRVYSARWSSSKDAWTAPVPLSRDGFWTTLPCVGMDAAGNAFVAWSESTAWDFPSSELHCASIDANSNPGPVTTFTMPDGTQDPSEPRLAMNASGKAAMTFLVTVGSAKRVAAVLFDSAWGDVTLVQTGGGTARNPSVSVGGEGTVLVVWDGGDPGNGFVRSRAYGNLYRR